MQRTDPVLPPRGRAGTTAEEDRRRRCGRSVRAGRKAGAAAAIGGDWKSGWLAAKGKGKWKWMGF
jgi:hypothetical protein